MAVALAAALVYSNRHADVGTFSGELTGSGSSGLTDLGGLASYVWQFYFSPLTGMVPPPGEGGVPGYRQIYVQQFLTGQFGSLEVQYADTVYAVLQVAQALGLIALFALVVRHLGRVRAHGAQIVVLLAFLVSMLVLLHVAAWQDISSPVHASLLAGRYLVCLAAIFGVAVASVVELRAASRRRRARRARAGHRRGPRRRRDLREPGAVLCVGPRSSPSSWCSSSARSRWRSCCCATASP